MMTKEQGTSSGRKRWDYLRTQIDANKIKDSDQALAHMGREGWEMVNAVFTNSYVHFWFKREVK